MKYILHFCFALGAIAQGGLDVPQVGLMVDHSGSLRAVHGLGQTYLAGSAIRTGVLSASCGARMCLSKTAGTLFVSTDPEEAGIPAPDGPVLFSIHGDSALLYFPASRRFGRLESGQFALLPWSIDGDVLAIRETRDGVTVVVRRGDGIRIAGLDGSLGAALPVNAAAVMFIHAGLVYTVPDRVILKRDDGTELWFPVPGAVSLSAISERYLQVVTGSNAYALRIDPGHEQLSLLPDSSLALSGGSQ